MASQFLGLALYEALFMGAVFFLFTPMMTARCWLARFSAVRCVLAPLSLMAKSAPSTFRLNRLPATSATFRHPTNRPRPWSLCSTPTKTAQWARAMLWSSPAAKRSSSSPAVCCSQEKWKHNAVGYIGGNCVENTTHNRYQQNLAVCPKAHRFFVCLLWKSYERIANFTLELFTFLKYCVRINLK